MKVATVNVIEYRTNGGILSVRSYFDNKNGNKAAERTFTKILKENAWDEEILKDDEEKIEGFIEDGIYENGDYQLFLTHSS